MSSSFDLIIGAISLPLSTYLLVRTTHLYGKIGGRMWYFAWEGFIIISVSTVLMAVYSFTGIVWLMEFGGTLSCLSPLFFGLAFLSLHLSLKSSLKAPSEGDLLRDDLIAADVYSTVVNSLILRIAPAVGERKIKTTVQERIEKNVFLKGSEIGEDGRINIVKAIRTLENIDGKRGMPGVFRGFSVILLELLDLYSASVSREHARELLEITFNEVRLRCGNRANKLIMPLLLTWKLLEPLIQKCDKKTILRFREITRSEGANLRCIDVDEYGNVGVDLLYETLADLPGEEWIGLLTAMLSEAIGTLRSIAGDRLAEMDEALSTNIMTLIGKYPELRKNLLDILPPDVGGEAHMLRGGRSYLVESPDSRRAYDLFKKIQKLGLSGLCISTVPPDEIEKRYGIEAEFVWITKQPVENGISPSNLDLLRDRIHDFVTGKGGIVLLEGLEYLFLINNTETVLTFMHDLKDIISIEKATLIVPISPQAVDGKQIGMLEAIMTVIK